jgi:hypothetical protein
MNLIQNSETVEIGVDDNSLMCGIVNEWRSPLGTFAEKGGKLFSSNVTRDLRYAICCWQKLVRESTET